MSIREILMLLEREQKIIHALLEQLRAELHRRKEVRDESGTRFSLD